MRLGTPHVHQCHPSRTIATPQLTEQVPPLTEELPTCDADEAAIESPADTGRVEAIAAFLGFGVNVAQVFGDRARRPRTSTKSDELRMGRVSAPSATQHRLRQQRFTPERDETEGVEILGMNGLEAHPA
jgi:hypothetical protein